MKKTISAVVCSALVGCQTAAPPVQAEAVARFNAHPEERSRDEVCALWRDSPQGLDYGLLSREMQRRYLKSEDCKGTTSAAQATNGSNVGGIVVLGLAAALVYQLARHGGGGPGPASAVDTDWAWDQQWNATRTGPQWVCRGRQTAQYADEWHCAGKPMIDSTWPGW
jgi:hypothetical protein